MLISPSPEHAQSSQNNSKINTEIQVSIEHMQSGTSQKNPVLVKFELSAVHRISKKNILVKILLLKGKAA